MNLKLKNRQFLALEENLGIKTKSFELESSCEKMFFQLMRDC